MKISIAPRFKIEIIKRVKCPGGDLMPGEVLDGLSLHNKPIDGLRFYFNAEAYVLVPLDCFKLLKRY